MAGFITEVLTVEVLTVEAAPPPVMHDGEVGVQALWLNGIIALSTGLLVSVLCRSSFPVRLSCRGSVLEKLIFKLNLKIYIKNNAAKIKPNLCKIHVRVSGSEAAHIKKLRVLVDIM